MKISALFLILIIIILSVPACTPDQQVATADEEEKQPSNNDLHTIQNLTPPATGEDAPDKGNPRLDFNIKRLILAESKGEAEEFARLRPSSVELIDGSVRVIIECEPGQADAVAKEIPSVDTKIEIVNISRDLIQVVVPITSLAALADIQGVRLVRLPWVPQTE